MKNLFLPTPENNYRARLLSLPVLSIFALILVLVNTTAGFLPVSPVAASIAPESLLEMHNRERRKQDLPPLKLNPVLSNSAKQKSDAMLETNCWSHYCPEGKSPWEFFDAAGYDYQVAGENLAEGFFDNEDVMVAWMNSPTHRENVLKAEYEEVGFGISYGYFQGRPNNTIITVHFGTPRVAAAQISNPQAGELPTPEITFPRDGEAYSTEDLEISGTAPEASEVEILNNGRSFVTTDPDEGIFIYRVDSIAEAEYSLSAQSRVGTRESSKSPAINFEIDRTPEVLSSDLVDVIRIIENSNTAVVHVRKADLSSIQLNFSEASYRGNPVSTSLWSFDIPVEAIEAADSFQVSTADAAGNTWSGDLDAARLQQQLETSQYVLIDPEQEGRVEAAFVRSGFNLGALFILLLMFGVDFIVLSKTGFTRKRSRFPLHFGIFIVIAVVIMTGTFAGQIGTGLSL